jgi:antitoxin (DNA-binding transcriptional repressor) of toxin-antitoxin stability system
MSGRNGLQPLFREFTGRLAVLFLTLFNGREFWHSWAMTTITLEKAQQDLPVLVERALAGEEIVIEAAGAAAVRLAPVAPIAHQPVPSGASYRGRGALKGQLVVGPEFFEPLSDEGWGIGGAPGAA